MSTDPTSRLAPLTADEKLLWGLVRNVQGYEHQRRWRAVMQATGCGSTKAVELCVRFDVDPNSVWKHEREKGWQ